LGELPVDGLRALDGGPLDTVMLDGRAVLVVNVASHCGMTPQLAALERLQKRFGDRGFTVLGVPCNQFAGQAPGTAQELHTFCSSTYGTTFPMTEKVDVNGRQRHPLYEWLVETPDPAGVAGEVDWNFEKFVVSAAGEVVARFRPAVDPEADEVLDAIERALP